MYRATIRDRDGTFLSVGDVVINQRNELFKVTGFNYELGFVHVTYYSEPWKGTGIIPVMLKKASDKDRD